MSARSSGIKGQPDLRHFSSWTAGSGTQRSGRFSSAGSILAAPSVQSILQEITADRCTSVSFAAARYHLSGDSSRWDGADGGLVLCSVLVRKGLEVLEAALDYDRYGFRFTPDRNLRCVPPCSCCRAGA
jgi:hypothetical protein